MEQSQGHRVAIIGGARTPFAKAGTALAYVPALQLGAHAVRGLVDRHSLEPDQIQELVYGTVVADPRVSNIAREIVFELGLPATIHAHAVSNNCITGIEAITSVAASIAQGRVHTGVAGGAESLSRPPILFPDEMATLLQRLARARSLGQRLSVLAAIRPRHFKPQAPQVAERSTGLSMGQHCELMAKQWQVSRDDQDAVAYRSHRNATRAQEQGLFADEIVPMQGVERDLIVRPDTTMEKLAALPPVFDRGPEGTLTAGNSSPLTDGASAVLLMSEQQAHRQGRQPLAFIRDYEYAAIDPDDGLLMAPAVAVPRLLARTGLRLQQMQIVEMHEAFGAQVIANLRAWQQGWKQPAIGAVDPDSLNPQGSSIAIGHPFAATGGRIVTTLALQMQRSGARYGLVSICAAGAMAAAMILERD